MKARERGKKEKKKSISILFHKPTDIFDQIHTKISTRDLLSVDAAFGTAFFFPFLSIPFLFPYIFLSFSSSSSFFLSVAAPHKGKGSLKWPVLSSLLSPSLSLSHSSLSLSFLSLPTCSVLSAQSSKRRGRGKKEREREGRSV